MKCSFCGADSRVTDRKVLPEKHCVVLYRACTRQHRFMTAEVYISQLADAREMSCAVRNITRRIQRFQRDMAIASDARPVRDVADAFNLTETRVRQICSAMRPLLKISKRTKIIKLRKETANESNTGKFYSGSKGVVNLHQVHKAHHESWLDERNPRLARGKKAR